MVDFPDSPDPEERWTISNILYMDCFWISPSKRILHSFLNLRLSSSSCLSIMTLLSFASLLSVVDIHIPILRKTSVWCYSCCCFLIAGRFFRYRYIGQEPPCAEARRRFGEMKVAHSRGGGSVIAPIVEAVGQAMPLSDQGLRLK
jgi:hypothetical protein